MQFTGKMNNNKRPLREHEVTGNQNTEGLKFRGVLCYSDTGIGIARIVPKNAPQVIVTAPFQFPRPFCCFSDL